MWSLSESRQGKFVPRSLPAADLSRSNGYEPGFRKHALRGDILLAGRGPERPEPVLPAGKPAQLPQSGRRHPTTCGPLRYAITDLRSPIHDVVEVESADDRLVFINEHVKNADPGLLLGQERAVPLRELIKEIVATIADRLGEVRAVRSLKIEERCLVVRAKTLQFGHR
jgi:hypothetical protein